MSNKKKTYLILGSNSFSGSNFIDYLLNKKHEVIGVSRSKEIKKEFLPYKHNLSSKLFIFKKIDINKDLKKLARVVKKYKPSIIVNYIAQGMVAESWIKPEDWYRTNVVSQVLLYKELAKFKFIKKFIHVTTPEVYGSTPKLIKENFNFRPSTPYAISRAAMDTHLKKLFQNYKFPVIFTRTSNVYGPGQQLFRIIPKAFMCLKKKIKLYLHGGGKSLRSFIYISDVSKATYLISKKGKIGETYHISTKNFISIKQVVKNIASIEKISFDRFCKIEKERVGKDHSYKLDCSKIYREMKWRPIISLNKGLAFTKKWIDVNYLNFKSLNLNYKHKI